MATKLAKANQYVLLQILKNIDKKKTSAARKFWLNKKLTFFDLITLESLMVSLRNWFVGR